MNKKALVLALILLVIPIMSAIPVQAGKGQERLSIRFEVGSYDDATGSVERIWNSPKKVELPEYSRVLHIRGGDWGDPATHEDFLIVVDETGLNIEFDNDDITYSCSYDLELRNVLYGQEAPPYLVMNIRVRETWEIGNGDYEGYIEILTVDKVYDYANLYEGTNGGGSFVGHGVINDQQIKLSGESILEGSTQPDREGMVMGWPTP